METNRATELSQFKEQINLSEYAASIGYCIDRTESSKNSIVMRKGDDKIIIALSAESQHYIYFSVRDDNDNGTIIDFIQNRTNESLGFVRKELRPWIGESAIQRPIIESYEKNIQPTQKDREHILREFSKLKVISDHPYLIERGISEVTQIHKRFLGKIYRDTKRNVAFPHYDEKGLVGFELKNKNFTGMPKGSSKTVWISNAFKTDKRLVITESGIEALSHFSLFKNLHDRYISMGGSWSPQAAKLVALMISKFKGSDLVLAFNNDNAGREMIAKLQAFLEKENLIETLKLIIEKPKQDNYDWNNVLKEKIEQKENLNKSRTPKQKTAISVD